MINIIKAQWQQLDKRERLILGCGALIVFVILFYALIWQPWHRAISEMQGRIEGRRADLVWMQQQSEMVKNGDIVHSTRIIQAANQSLLSVIEQTARANQVSNSIQQMAPSTDAPVGMDQVNVVLEEADFNQWVTWVDNLYRDYAVSIKQLTVENDTGQPNVVELRVTFERG